MDTCRKCTRTHTMPATQRWSPTESPCDARSRPKLASCDGWCWTVDRWQYQTRRNGKRSTRRGQQIVSAYADHAGVKATPHTFVGLIRNDLPRTQLHRSLCGSRLSPAPYLRRGLIGSVQKCRPDGLPGTHRPSHSIHTRWTSSFADSLHPQRLLTAVATNVEIPLIKVFISVLGGRVATLNLFARFRLLALAPLIFRCRNVRAGTWFVLA